MTTDPTCVSVCTARMIEPRANTRGEMDTWLCQLPAGHDGQHHARGGKRNWDGGDGWTWNPKDEMIEIRLTVAAARSGSLVVIWAGSRNTPVMNAIVPVPAAEFLGRLTG